MQNPEELAQQLSTAEKTVLQCSSDGEWVYPARDVAASAQLPLSLVRRIQRKLKAMGILQFGFLLNDDTGLLCGRGYFRTRLGSDILKTLNLPYIG